MKQFGQMPSPAIHSGKNSPALPRARHCGFTGVAQFCLTFLIVMNCFGVSPAKADLFSGISELRVGIFDHNIESGNSEDGVDINIEAIFGNNQARYQHSLIGRLFSPDQHFGISVNLNDDTNVVYSGLTWTLYRNDYFFLEAALGGALHDGSLSDIIDASYGCRANFRSAGSLGVIISPNWHVLFTVDHMSNAGLCDENRGLTNAGVRLGYRLGG